MQVDSAISDTNGFINFWLLSIAKAILLEEQ